MLLEANDPAGNYDSMQDELFTHVAICTMANLNIYMGMYLTDCQCIWDNIAAIMHELDFWTYVCPAQHTSDGCLAYQNLNRHYYGKPKCLYGNIFDQSSACLGQDHGDHVSLIAGLLSALLIIPEMAVWPTRT